MLLYLPLYSPDFNPIEEFFLVFKAWLKQHFKLVEGMRFGAFLKEAVIACNGGGHIKGHFEHTGIYLGEYEGELKEQFQDNYDSEK